MTHAERVQCTSKEFSAADDAWSIELQRLFGKRAGDVRYTKQGEGAPGSELRRLHECRTFARMQWEMACQDRDAGVPLFTLGT